MGEYHISFPDLFEENKYHDVRRVINPLNLSFSSPFFYPFKRMVNFFLITTTVQYPSNESLREYLMSRTDADQKVWTVTTKMPDKVTPDGQGQAQQLQTYRSQETGNASTPVDEGVLVILMQFLLDNAKRRILLKNKNPEIQKHVAAIRGGFSGLNSHIKVPDVWIVIMSFAIGFDATNLSAPLRRLGSYAFCLHKPRLLQQKSLGLFPVITLHPDVLVEAILHGDETMVRHILKTNPDLTEKGTGIDFSGRSFTGTALQAAIACGDFAPNKNSTGLCELIVEQLKHQYPDQGHQLFHDQALELYTKSLRFYAEKQLNKIRALTEKKDSGEVIDEAKLATAKQRHQTYLKALHSNDLTTIINTHTNPDPDPTKPDILDTQKDHVFQINQALIDKIAAVSDTEIQTVLNNPTIDSLLSNLLKQFRSNFEKLSHEEIIFNPQHLLKIFNLYDEFYDRVERTDPNWKKRELFWCHLVGFVQRYLPANIAQVFANPGLYDVVEEKKKNSRVFDFKYGGGSIFPLSFDSNSGLGYKFALGGVRAGDRGLVGGGASTGWRSGAWHCARGVTKLMSSKNNKLSRLVTNLVQANARKSERSCVIS